MLFFEKNMGIYDRFVCLLRRFTIRLGTYFNKMTYISQRLLKYYTLTRAEMRKIYFIIMKPQLFPGEHFESITICLRQIQNWD